MQVGSIYDCEIRHERISPRSHSFSARHIMFYLHLEELISKERTFSLLGVNTANLYAFHERDYLPDFEVASSSLIQRVKDAILKLGVESPVDRIDLLTNVRIFGYVFNPVSFYFCFDLEKILVCCLCEVGNTFGEKKLFLVKPDSDGLLRARQKKFFYVSPFAELDQDFCFDISVPNDSLSIRIDTTDGDVPVVRAAIRGRRLDLSDFNLARALFLHPWATAKVITLIHLHAFILWCKKVPFHEKDEQLDLQVDVLNRRRRTGATALRKGRNP